MTAERGLRFRGAEVEWSGGGSGESRDFHDTEKLRYLENRSCDGRVHRKSRLSIESVLTNSSSSRPESPHRTIPLSGRPPTSPGSPREGGILQIAENRDKSPELVGERFGVFDFAPRDPRRGLLRDLPSSVSSKFGVSGGGRGLGRKTGHYLVVSVRVSQDN